MGGCLAWRDQARDDLNGEPALVNGGLFSTLQFDPAFPARNCLNPDLSRVTRVDYDGQHYFALNVQMSTNNDKEIQVMAALNCRVPPEFTSVQAFAMDKNSVVLQSGIVYGTTDYVKIPDTEDRYDLFWLLPTLQTGVSIVQFRFQAPSVTSGYIEVGRLWCGTCLHFTKGLGVDWSLSGVDPSRIFRSEGGGYAAFPYPTRKVLSVTKNGLNYVESMGAYGVDSIRDLILGAGTSSPIIVMSDDSNQHIAQVGSVYGLITAVPSIDHLGKLKFGTSMRIEQLR